jgi:hypothetical protein
MSEGYLPTVAIPDLHGSLRRFHLALSHALPDAHHLIMLGDVIDNGTDTQALLAEIRALHDTHHLQYIVGNQEELMINAIYGLPGHRHAPSAEPQDTREWRNWLLNGGQDTLDTYDDQAALLSDAEWIRTHAKRWIIRNNWLYAHATRPGPNEQHSSEHQLFLDGGDKILWARPRASRDLHDLDSALTGSVHGHTPRTTPGFVSDRLGKPAWFIDLGPNTLKIAIHHSETGVHVLDTPAEHPRGPGECRKTTDHSDRLLVRLARTRLRPALQ